PEPAPGLTPSCSSSAGAIRSHVVASSVSSSRFSVSALACSEGVGGDVRVPDRAERAPEAAGGDGASAFLVVEVPSVVYGGERPPAAAEGPEVARLVADEEDEALRQRSGAPVLPAEVTAEHGRQAARVAVELEGGGLAVVAGDDRAVSALADGEAPPGVRGLVGELGPAELVLVEALLPDAGGDHRGGAAYGHDDRGGERQRRNLQRDERRQNEQPRAAAGTQPGGKTGDAGGDRDRVGRQRVVGAAALEQEEDGDERRYERERPQPLPAPEDGDADRGEDEAGAEEELLGEVGGGRRVGGRLGVLAGGEVDARPAVLGLPDQVGQEEREREGEAEPRPARPEQPPLAGGEQGRAEGEEDDGDRVLRLEADARDRAGDEPEPRPLAAEGEQDDVEERDPAERVEPDGVEEAAGAERVGADRPGQCRGDLRGRAGAELACDQRDQHGRAEHRGERRQAQRDERVAEEGVHEPADPGGQRREVDVAPGRPPRCGEEVELVPVPAVAAEEGRDHGRLDGGGERAAGERRREPGRGARAQQRRLGSDGGTTHPAAAPRPTPGSPGMRRRPRARTGSPSANARAASAPVKIAVDPCACTS